MPKDFFPEPTSHEHFMKRVQASRTRQTRAKNAVAAEDEKAAREAYVNYYAYRCSSLEELPNVNEAMYSSTTVSASTKAAVSVTQTSSASQKATDYTIETRPDGTRIEHGHSVETTMSEATKVKMSIAVTQSYKKATHSVAEKLARKGVPHYNIEQCKQMFADWNQMFDVPNHWAFRNYNVPIEASAALRAPFYAQAKASVPFPFPADLQATTVIAAYSNYTLASMQYQQAINKAAQVDVYTGTSCFPAPVNITQEAMAGPHGLLRFGGVLSKEELAFDAGTYLPDEAVSIHTVMRIMKNEGPTDEMRAWKLLSVEKLSHEICSFRATTLRLGSKCLRDFNQIVYLHPDEGDLTADCTWVTLRAEIPVLGRVVHLTLPCRYLQCLSAFLGQSNDQATVDAFVPAFLKELQVQDEDEPSVAFEGLRIPRRVLEKYPEEYREAEALRLDYNTKLLGEGEVLGMFLE